MGTSVFLPGPVVNPFDQDLNSFDQVEFAGITDTDLTETRVTFAGSGGVLEDSSVLIYDKTNKVLNIGDTNGIDIAMNADRPRIVATPIGAAKNVSVMAAGLQPNGYGAFATIAPRGTLASPTANQTGDVTGQVDFYGYNGTFGNDTAFIISYVGTVIDGEDGTSGRLSFFVTDSNLVPRRVLDFQDNHSATFLDPISLTPTAFASLPTGAEGMIAAITDSNTATWGATIAGGGANNVLGFFNGANWTVAGK